MSSATVQAQHFAAPKISYPHFSQGRKFSFEPQGYFSNDKTYLIPSEDKALLGLLNSTLIWGVLRGICPALRGGEWRLELRVQYLEKVPIPAWDDGARAELAAASEQASKAA